MSKIRRPKPPLPKADTEKTAAVKYFNLEKVSVKGFCGFCKNNIPLVIAVTLTLFFTYGIRLFWYAIGIDEEMFWARKDFSMMMELESGRFGLYLLQRLWYIREFNPFTAFFAALCLAWFFTLSWCYIIAIFSKNTGRNNRLIPFALSFMTVPVWAELFSFVFQSVEIGLMIGICPYAIYLLYKGILDSEKWKITGGVLLLFFMTSVYQAMVPLFCCGVFGCFLLLQENSEYEPKVYRLLCLKLFLALLAALGAYFLARELVYFIFHVERNQYLENMIGWNKRPPIVNLFDILMFCYALTVGHIPAVQAIMGPIFERSDAVVGIKVFEYISNQSKILGNAMLLPGVILFLFTVFKTKNNVIPPGRKFLYNLAGTGVPLSILLLAVMAGSRPPLRALFALPLASAFMFYFLIRALKKKAAAVFACLVLCTAVYQAEISAQLLYSSHLLYNEQVQVAFELKKMITASQSGESEIPVVFIGKYRSNYRGHENFLPGDANGVPSLGVFPSLRENTMHGLDFLETLGIHFEMPTYEQMERVFKEYESMLSYPVYPDPGCVRRLPGRAAHGEDVIVVKMGDLNN